MGNQVCEYQEMTASQLAALDRSMTLALMVRTLLEVHGRLLKPRFRSLCFPERIS